MQEIYLINAWTEGQKEQYEDTKVAIRSRESKDRQYNGQKKKDKQWCTKHDTENYWSSNTNPIWKPGVNSGAP
jgi:hypothetical protein